MMDTLKRRTALMVVLLLTAVFFLKLPANAEEPSIKEGLDAGVSLNTRNNPFVLNDAGLADRLAYQNEVTAKLRDRVAAQALYYNIRVYFDYEDSLESEAFAVHDVDGYFNELTEWSRDNMILLLYVCDVNEARVYVGKNLSLPAIDTEAVAAAFMAGKNGDKLSMCIDGLDKLAESLPIDKVMFGPSFDYDDDSDKVKMAECFSRIRELYPDTLIHVNTYYAKTLEEAGVSAAEYVGQIIERSQKSGGLQYNIDKSISIFYFDNGDAVVRIGTKTGIRGVHVRRVEKAFKPTEYDGDVSGFDSGVNALTRELEGNGNALAWVKPLCAFCLCAAALALYKKKR